MPKVNRVPNKAKPRPGFPNYGSALILLLIVACLSLFACSRIPNPFGSFGDGNQAVAAQRSTSSPLPTVSTAIEPTGTAAARPGLDATATLTPQSILDTPTVIGSEPTVTPATVGPTGQLALSPTKTPRERSRRGPADISDLSDIFASATPTETPLATAVPPTPEVTPTATPTDTPEPDPLGGTGIPGGGVLPGSATATAVQTDTPTRTPEPTEKPVYGGGGSPGGGAGGIGGGGTTGPTATPTPFGLSSPTPTIVPTETPIPGAPPTATRTPFPTATLIPPGTYDAVVNVLMMPNDFQVDTDEEFSFDIIVDPNGQEITVAQAVLGFDPNYLKATSSIHDPNSPLPNQITADDNFDNSAGIVILSSAPHNSSTLPVSSFRLGTVTFKAKNNGGQTDIFFVRSGEVITRAGLSGFNLIDVYDLSTVSINNPPTVTPTPTP